MDRQPKRNGTKPESGKERSMAEKKGLLNAIMDASEKQRVVQEYVPGKQITLAHLIANPRPDLFKKWVWSGFTGPSAS